ncbi:coniferyl aldehyde dehydrogenase [Saccharopolyspora mangrovi]|uniref:Aldehyde dehydrogenase n=1 Tax=Saccharopolyspora mangrovi TaxID=3082379 RepID=A0ABU6AIW2_9PSEU|nr:coniferyl aldehyde dehydrogenase [Saccharopolyspora sp. S2-29]MEB3371371.1 coniferyl aldehyde dehydrogenase [Saccharopolyspora sp. S2-29]
MTTTNKDSTNSATRPRNSAVKPPRSDHAQTATYSEELDKIFARQRTAFDRNPAPSLRERGANLLKLQSLIERNRLLFVEAANKDFGTRAAVETEMSEIVGTISIIRYMRSNLRSWMAPRRRSVSIWFKPAKNRVEPSPLGVVGIVSPWNYPLHLALIPAATALAAGNRVMLKVSEFTPHTSAVLKRLIEENFSPDVFSVTDGAGEVASKFTTLPFDHLLFTGSTQVGKIVAKAAAENLTPVTLELGGKSPVIVDENYPIERAAANVAWAKLLNGGQVCVSPDYVLVPRGREKEFAIAARGAAHKLYPKFAGNPDYTAILNERHYDRVNAYITEAKALDLEVITVEDPELGRERRQLPLTMVINPPADSSVMKDEIFGPVLPIIGYDGDHAAVNFVNSRPTPLALYVLSNGKHRQRQWLTRVASGSAVVNDLMVGYLQNDLPFGGRGGSGYGAYHGREGFDAMSHLRPVMYQRAIFGRTGVQMLYPPYGKIVDVLLKLMRRI